MTSSTGAGDDVTIEDDDLLYRRLAKHQVKKQGRASSLAFLTRDREPEHEPSLDLAKLTTPDESVNRSGREGFRLSQFAASCPRSLDGLEVCYSPQPDNPAHSHIDGMISHHQSRQLAGMLELLEVYSLPAAE